MTKLVAVTGHTKGIGLAISNYFLKKNYIVQGYSRSNGYDISNENIRQKIIHDAKDVDIFVNNAYCNFTDAQLDILKCIYNQWQDQNKIIINMSTRFTTGNNIYSQSKKQLDIFCDSTIYNRYPYVINLKPGLIDTQRVKAIHGNKMDVDDLTTVLDVLLNFDNKIRFNAISFGK